MDENKSLSYPVSNDISVAVPPRMDVDELFATIKAVAAPIENEVPPGFFKMLVVPGAREYVQEIQKVKTEQVKARKIYIQRLGNMVEVYVKHHEDRLREIGIANLMATFADLLAALLRVTDRALTSFWDTYAETVERINANRVLTPEQKLAEVTKAFARIERAQSNADRAFQTQLTQFNEQVNAMISWTQR